MIRKICSRKIQMWLLIPVLVYSSMFLYTSNVIDTRMVTKLQSEMLRMNLSQPDRAMTTKINDDVNSPDLVHVHRFQHPGGPLDNIDTKDFVTFGYQRTSRGFLTLGIPTVKRKSGCEYLLHTLDSLIKETSEADKLRTVLVIFLADENQTYNDDVRAVLTETYQKHFESGFMQILKPPPKYYPDMTHLKKNFGDEEARVRWRSKQVLDYAFMFYYCANMSDYYMQLEDDVLPAVGYLDKIEKFIKASSSKYWVELDFTNMGYIGKLYKRENMARLAQFMMMFYQEQPVDWLNDYFVHTLAQKKPMIYKPPLFSHIGLYSSFAKNGKRKVNLKDKARFLKHNTNCLRNNEKGQTGLMPDVDIFSTMNAYKPLFGPESAYNSTGDYFWAVEPKQNDTLTVVYSGVKNVTHILIQTGSASKPKDTLKIGSVYVSKGRNGPSTVECVDLQKVASCNSGKCEYMGETIKGVRCIVVKVEKPQKDWIIFSQFLVRY